MYLLTMAIQDPDFTVKTEFYPNKEKAVKTMNSGILKVTPFKSLDEIVGYAKRGLCGYTDNSAWAETKKGYPVRWDIIEVPGKHPDEIKAELDKRMAENEENLEENEGGYDQGYAEGYHDCLVEMYAYFGIKTEEDYYN
jgi:hypothetical protein